MKSQKEQAVSWRVLRGGMAVDGMGDGPKRREGAWEQHVIKPASYMEPRLGPCPLAPIGASWRHWKMSKKVKDVFFLTGVRQKEKKRERMRQRERKRVREEFKMALATKHLCPQSVMQKAELHVWTNEFENGNTGGNHHKGKMGKIWEMAQWFTIKIQ